MSKTLIINIQYSGLGDHLFHSHLPRIAKEYNRFDKVFISNESRFAHPDYRKIVWEMNPFIDGFTDEQGIRCDIGELVKKVNRNSEYNLLDHVMFHYELDNGMKWNQPEIFYKPKYLSKFNHIIFDPNFVSWVGNITDEDATLYFKKNRISFDYIMKLRGNKVLYCPDNNTKFIETPSLEDFCDLIYSAKKLYCLTSGTATLAAAIRKSAIVFYGIQQEDGYKHFKNHNYILIPRYLKLRIKRTLKRIFNISQ